MIRRLALMLALALPCAAPAQEFAGLARLDVAQSIVEDAGDGLGVTLYLSQPVPFRVFTLAEPNRLVMDFREVDWRGATRAGMLNADNATDLRFGLLRPGWSRLVVDLGAPMVVDQAGMTVDKASGTALVTAQLVPATQTEFAARAGAPPDPDWAFEPVRAEPEQTPPEDDGMLTVVIDPGHGGIDPGATRQGMVEADEMLRLGLELADALARSGNIRPVLTRNEDIFVPLADRMSIARAAGADLFLSLHADALDDTVTRGAAVYTLTDEAQDAASTRMTERHDRGDLLAGLDLTGQDDTVATVLMDLARLETGPQSERLAAEMVTAMEDLGVRMNSRPRRQARLAVLMAADFPSILIEIGFLSNESDRQVIGTAGGGAVVFAGLVQAIERWQAGEEARAPLVRQ